jgi:hypothetical protein
VQNEVKKPFLRLETERERRRRRKRRRRRRRKRRVSKIHTKSLHNYFILLVLVLVF